MGALSVVGHAVDEYAVGYVCLLAMLVLVGMGVADGTALWGGVIATAISLACTIVSVLRHGRLP